MALTWRAHAGWAVADVLRSYGRLGGRGSGSRVAVLYALAALGPSSVTADRLAAAILVTEGYVPRLLEELEEARLVATVTGQPAGATPRFTLGPVLLDAIDKLTAEHEANR